MGEYTDPGNVQHFSNVADDFLVPEGATKQVRYVNAFAQYSQYNGNHIGALNICYYNDDNNKPSTVIHDFD